jgi:hypothetical protein
MSRINGIFERDLSKESLLKVEKDYRDAIEQSFSDGTWNAKLPGRDILRQFVSVEKLPVAYEIFRNLIVSRMAEIGHKPEGMKKIIEAIYAD